MMNLNHKANMQRFANFQRGGMASIIESKSLMNIIKIEENEKLPIAHEKILFTTIAGNSDLASPEIKLLSMLGHFESELSKKEGKNKLQKINQI